MHDCAVDEMLHWLPYILISFVAHSLDQVLSYPHAPSLVCDLVHSVEFVVSLLERCLRRLRRSGRSSHLVLRHAGRDYDGLDQAVLGHGCLICATTLPSQHDTTWHRRATP